MAAVLTKLPAAVIIIAIMLVGATVLRLAAITPGQVGLFLGGDVAYLLELAVVLLPYLAAIAGLVGLVEFTINRRERAMEAGIAAAVMVVIDIVWHLGAGSWAIAHLTGAA